MIGDPVGNLLLGFLSVLPSVMSLTSVLTKLCRRSSIERLEDSIAKAAGRTDSPPPAAPSISSTTTQVGLFLPSS